MIDKLEMFIALARERHFGRAAELLNIAQPTLSAGIKQLEEQLGVQLVFRGSRFGGLTPEGQSALIWAQRIVADARQLRDEMRTRRQGLTGELRLAVIPTALNRSVALAGAFGRRHPGVRFIILSRNSREILHMLDTFEADAGLTYLDNEPLGRVDCVPLYEERYVLVCTRDAPQASRRALTWRELDGTTLALLTPDMQNRRIVNGIFSAFGVEPRASIETNSIIALIAAVVSGGCMTVLPSEIAQFLAAGHDLALVPLVGARGQDHSVGLVAPHRDPRTPVIAALMAEAERLADGR